MGLSTQHLVDLLRAAGEPTRLRILGLLAREELAVMEITQILDQSQPRVSRHLKLLTEAGLIERFPDGAWMFYRLADRGPRRRLLRSTCGGGGHGGGRCLHGSLGALARPENAGDRDAERRIPGASER